MPVLEQIQFDDNWSPFLLSEIEAAVDIIHIMVVVPGRVECLHLNFLIGLGWLRALVPTVTIFMVRADMDHPFFMALLLLVLADVISRVQMFSACGFLGVGDKVAYVFGVLCWGVVLFVVVRVPRAARPLATVVGHASIAAFIIGGHLRWCSAPGPR